MSNKNDVIDVAFRKGRIFFKFIQKNFFFFFTYFLLDERKECSGQGIKPKGMTY